MPYRRITRFVLAPDGTRIAYHTHTGSAPEHRLEEVLASRPTVLLTNGIGTSENFWRYIVADLEQDHRVVHWDYRGHGQSDVSSGGDCSLLAHMADLERITETVMARGNGAPLHHVAFSMGVRVLLELYRRRPELVSALTLIAGGPGVPGSVSPLLGVPGSRAVLARSLQAMTPLVPVAAPLVHQLITSSLMYPLARGAGVLRARAPRADIEEMMLALRRMDPRAYWMTLRGLVEGPESWDVLPRVTVPTQIIAAENDHFVSLRELERMREALPHAQWLLVEDAGHAGLLEAGTEIAEAVRAFRAARGLGPARPAG